jgi:hypothetical protein
MTPTHFKIQLVRQFLGGFSSVLVTQENGREDFWVLADAVIHGLMERQAGQTDSATT